MSTTIPRWAKRSLRNYDRRMRGEQYVVSAAPFDLVHEEHDTIALPPGTYHVIRQREYTPEEIRQVRD